MPVEYAAISRNSASKMLPPKFNCPQLANPHTTFQSRKTSLSGSLIDSSKPFKPSQPHSKSRQRENSLSMRTIDPNHSFYESLEYMHQTPKSFGNLKK